jgi:hypothetical protein
MTHESFARFVELKMEWAGAVGSYDPDSLDDWPVDRIIELEKTNRMLRNKAVGFRSDILAACIENGNFDSLYKNIMDVIERYEF